MNTHIHWFGWCKDESKNADKVWGWMDIDGNLYNFWGRRGGKLSFKRHPQGTVFDYICQTKTSKGYVSIPEIEIEKVYPNFYKKVLADLFTAKISNKVRTDDVKF